MRRLSLFLICFIAATSLFAQSGKRTEAITYLNNNKLSKAKEAIDAACKHEDTKDDAKTLFYRGKVYQEIYNQAVAKKIFLFKKLVNDNLLFESYDAYVKVLDISKKEIVKKVTPRPEKKSIKFAKKNKKEVITNLGYLQQFFINQGVAAYQASNYELAFNTFDKSVIIGDMEAISKVDTAIIYYAGLTASESKKYDEAVKYYDRTLKLKYTGDDTKPGDVCFRKIKALQAKGDTATSISIIKEGIKKYPNSNKNLILELVNYYLKKNDGPAALEYIDAAIAKEPKNFSLHFAKGAVLSQLKGKEKETTASYERALAINPSHFDSNYNLGVIYYNKAAETLQEADKIDLRDVKKYDAKLKEANDQFKVALPYFEKCYEVNPKEEFAIRQLKIIYNKLKKDNPEMKEKLKNLNN